MPLRSITNPSNFRDLAEHAGTSAPMRRRVLFRSDHLGALDEGDARQIQALGIRRVLDFRGVDERTSAACMLPDVTVHSLAIEPTIVQQIKGFTDAGRQLTGDDVVAMMQETYRGFVRTSTHRFAEFFGHLLESDQPTVFHCTAGKDRTGFAAALVLRALDVPEDAVMRDYLLTNERLKAPTGSLWGLPPEAVGVLYRVQPDFLQAAFDAVDADYGGIEGYLREGLGLREAERARLRALYLQR
jgi:protein-tyrosine phosphatase